MKKLHCCKELANLSRKLRRATEQMIQAIDTIKSGDEVILEILYLNDSKISERLMKITEELFELPDQEYQILEDILEEVWIELDYFKRFKKKLIQFLS